MSLDKHLNVFERICHWFPSATGSDSAGVRSKIHLHIDSSCGQRLPRKSEGDCQQFSSDWQVPLRQEEAFMDAQQQSAGHVRESKVGPAAPTQGLNADLL